MDSFELNKILGAVLATCLVLLTLIQRRADAAQAGPSATDVVNALFERPWRLVHIAGHGALPSKGQQGGVVLSNGAVLRPAESGCPARTAREIRSMASGSCVSSLWMRFRRRQRTYR